jgi:hypothetical protein
MEEFNIYSAIGEGLSHYFSMLDWAYIITFNLIAHYMTKDERVKDMPFDIRGILIRIPVSWRVLIVGILYGSFVYWIRGYQGKEGVETMMQSLIATMACHKLFLAYILKKLKL